jgi:hypothetical protein
MTSPTAPPNDAAEYSPPPTPPQPPTPAAEPPSRPYAAAILLIGGGLVWALVLLGVPIRWEVLLPAALIVLGGALLVSRRAATGGIVALGIVVLVVSLVLVPLSTGSFSADIGQREEVVTVVDDLAVIDDLGIGSLTVDLRGLQIEPGETASLSLSVGIGQLRLRVPDDVVVTGEGRAGIGAVHAGAIEAGAGTSGGLGVTVPFEGTIEGSAATDDASGTLDLDVEVGIGQVMVSR